MLELRLQVAAVAAEQVAALGIRLGVVESMLALVVAVWAYTDLALLVQVVRLLLVFEF
jgi:hypothetical protein